MEERDLAEDRIAEGGPDCPTKPFLIPTTTPSYPGGHFTLPFDDPLASTRIFTRRWTILPRELANLPCEIEPSTLLTWINTLFETNISLSPAVENCLSEFTDDNCDLGEIYGYLRPWMPNVLDEKDFAGLSAIIRERAQKDFEFRAAAIRSDGINPRVPPRRIWDLYANRVLPYHALAPNPLGDKFIPNNVWAVSHVWKPANQRKTVHSPINRNSWGIPMPARANLNELRNELLTVGAEYIWLDVLCMRLYDRAHLDSNDLRKKEWKLDLPTIGYIFQEDSDRPVVVYFNGLGIPFHDGPVDPDDSSHWLNRGWSLQEFPCRIIPGGLSTKVNAIDLRTFAPNETTASPSWASHQFLEALMAAWPQQIAYPFAEEEITLERAIIHANSRNYTYPIDKAVSLAYLLRCPVIPNMTPSHDADPNEYWKLLVQSISGRMRTELLFSYFPSMSPERTSWYPSWEQVVAGARFRRPENVKPDEDVQYLDNYSSRVGFRYDRDVYYHRAYVVEHCRFHKSSTVLPTQRRAYIEMPQITHTEERLFWEFKISEGGEQVKEDTPYLLISIGYLKSWVVAKFEGWRRIDGERAFEVSKVSTITIDETYNPFEYQDVSGIRHKVLGKTQLIVYR